MGRNNVPKLGVWDDGYFYDITIQGKPLVKDFNCGELISYSRQPRGGDRETLATAFADGDCSVAQTFYEHGYSKGFKAGIAKAKAEIRAAMGIV